MADKSKDTKYEKTIKRDDFEHLMDELTASIILTIKEATKRGLRGEKFEDILRDLYPELSHIPCE